MSLNIDPIFLAYILVTFCVTLKEAVKTIAVIKSFNYSEGILIFYNLFIHIFNFFFLGLIYCSYLRKTLTIFVRKLKLRFLTRLWIRPSKNSYNPSQNIWHFHCVKSARILSFSHTRTKYGEIRGIYSYSDIFSHRVFSVVARFPFTSSETELYYYH